MRELFIRARDLFVGARESFIGAHDTGPTKQEIHDARVIRDAEAADPRGISETVAAISGPILPHRLYTNASFVYE